jgi:transcriptional regulator with XRE-family HTH domain
MAREYDMKNLGTRVKQMRAKLGITQAALADRLGISRTCVTNWETGSRVVDIQYWEALSDIFGISIEILCGANEFDGDIEHIDLSRLSKQNRRLLIDYYFKLLKEDGFSPI